MVILFLLFYYNKKFREFLIVNVGSFGIVILVTIIILVLAIIVKTQYDKLVSARKDFS